jgi:hypothetical protein
VLLPTGAPKTGVGAAGIDSLAEFRVLMPFGHPRFETPRSAPVPQAFLPVFFRGWAMAIFIFLTSPLQPKCAYALSKEFGFERHFRPVEQLPDLPAMFSTRLGSFRIFAVEAEVAYS